MSIRLTAEGSKKKVQGARNGSLNMRRVQAEGYELTAEG
jgi:hypothetical protein